MNGAAAAAHTGEWASTFAVAAHGLLDAFELPTGINGGFGMVSERRLGESTDVVERDPDVRKLGISAIGRWEMLHLHWTAQGQ